MRGKLVLLNKIWIFLSYEGYVIDPHAPLTVSNGWYFLYGLPSCSNFSCLRLNSIIWAFIRIRWSRSRKLDALNFQLRTLSFGRKMKFACTPHWIHCQCKLREYASNNFNGLKTTKRKCLNFSFMPSYFFCKPTF